MKRSLAIAAAIVGAWTAVAAAEVPSVDTPVNDRAGVLSPSDIEQLDGAIVGLRVDTGAQLALLIVRTTSGVPIEDFALQVAEKWGGGTGKRSDGVLLVLALDDRRSRLDVGYDLEDRLTDGRARQILDAMGPSMRAADYAGALLGAVDEIARALSGLEPVVAYQREPTRSRSRESDVPETGLGVILGIFLVAIGLAVVLVLVLTALKRSGGGMFAFELLFAACQGMAAAQGSSSGWSSGSSSSSWGSGSSSRSTSSGGSSYSSPSWKGGGGKFGGGGASSSW